MEITLDALLKGKPTIIKDKSYFRTAEYVEPFIEHMTKFTEKFIVNVQTPDQRTVTDGDEDLTYNRVWIQAVMPEEHTIDAHDECYGLVYGLDVKTPIYKVYRGYLNQACTNLCVFDPQWQQVSELEPGSHFTYSIKNLMEATSNFEVKLKHMKSTYLSSDPDARHLLLGQMIEKSTLMEHRNVGGKVKISNSMVINAYESVYLDSESKYYVASGTESTLFNYHNAFTQIVRDDKKDILNRFEKSLLINSLFGL